MCCTKKLLLLLSTGAGRVSYVKTLLVSELLPGITDRSQHEVPACVPHVPGYALDEGSKDERAQASSPGSILALRRCGAAGSPEADVAGCAAATARAEPGWVPQLPLPLPLKVPIPELTASPEQ